MQIASPACFLLDSSQGAPFSPVVADKAQYPPVLSVLSLRESAVPARVLHFRGNPSVAGMARFPYHAETSVDDMDRLPRVLTHPRNDTVDRTARQVRRRATTEKVSFAAKNEADLSLVFFIQFLRQRLASRRRSGRSRRALQLLCQPRARRRRFVSSFPCR